MTKEETLLNEAREILVEGKKSLAVEKEIIYDKNVNQFSIKIPKEIVLASNIEQGEKIMIIARPSEEDIKKIQLSNFIIYGKEK
jgi:hypothetical protein